MNAKEFKNMIHEDEDKQEQYYAKIRQFESEGMEKTAAAVKAAAEMGYKFTKKELKAADSKLKRELSEDELEAVSGGALWLGDEAPDGHELQCIAWFYSNWREFYEANAYTYCYGGKGQKHILGPLFYEKYYTFAGPIRVQKCCLCGAIVPYMDDRKFGDRAH